MKMPVIDVWTDGACSPNPGSGGWAAILIYDEIEANISGGVEDTTNNRMELQAIFEALKFVKRPGEITIYTDSKLCIGWLSCGYPIYNPYILEICESIDAVILEHGHKVKFEKVPAHSGVEFNERVNFQAARIAKMS